MPLTDSFRRLPRPLRRHRLIDLMLRVSPSSRYDVIEMSNGIRFHGDLRQRGPRNALINGFTDPEFLQVARTFLAGREAPVMFDVGANYGIYSFSLIATVPMLEIHLFEANPQLCDLLRKSAALYPRNTIRVTNGCIASQSVGVSRFKIDESNTGVSHISETGDIEVRNLALADYVEENKIAEVSFGKFDIEGFEVQGFKGLLRPENDGVLKAFVVEVVNVHLARAGSTSVELFDLLQQRGFRLFHFRSSDFGGGYNSFLVDRSKCKTWIVNGQRLDLAPLDVEKARSESWQFGTDLLAVHRDVPMTEL